MSFRHHSPSTPPPSSSTTSSTIAPPPPKLQELFLLLERPTSSAKDVSKAIKSASKDLRKTNERGQTVFHVAAEANHLEAIKALLTNKKIPDLLHSRDGAGWTPLHYAAHNPQLWVFESLLVHGADPAVMTPDGDTPLHYLVRSRKWFDTAFYKVLESFIRTKGVDLNAQNINGETPLHFAAMGGNAEVVKILAKGSNVDLTTKAGETALHYACRYGHEDVVQYLISEAHANVTIAGRNGTPLDVAETHQQKAVAELLLAVQPKHRKHSAPQVAVPPGSGFTPPVTTSFSHSAPMPAVPVAKSRPRLTESTGSGSNLNLLAFCRVSFVPRGPASSSSSSWPAASPSSIILQADALLSRCQQRNCNYDFAYERDIIAHVEKEREDQKVIDERQKRYQEYLQNATRGRTGSNRGPSPAGAATSPVGKGPVPVNGAAFSYTAGAGNHASPVHPAHPTHHAPTPIAAIIAATGGGPSPYSHPVSSSAGAVPTNTRLSSSNPHIRTVTEVHKAKSGSTGDLHRGTSTTAASAHRPRSASQPKQLPLNPAQEKMYLKIISENENLNTENVLIAVRNCNDPKSVLAYVKAYERIKPIGYSQAHVVEALNAYGGGAVGLTPQEEERQHQRMLAFLKLLVNKGFSPAGHVQDILSLFEYDVEKAEKFLAAYKTVSQMGFPDARVREALLLSDSDSEQAIRYLLEGK